MTTLNVNIRELVNKSGNKELRESGRVPAVFYGFKKDVTSLSVDKKEFMSVLKEAGETSTITLKTPNGEFNAMIHDVQVDPVKGEVIHVDFLSVDMNKAIEVEVPLEFTGESQAVKEGGVLVKVMHELSVSALPANIPQHIEVDLSKLSNIDAIITLGDLKLPTGVKFTEEDLSVVVASVTAQQEEVDTPTEINLDAIEVEKKGKKEEEGETASK
ncbi:MAG: large subunit ribosomal protein [Patescibacteria group bacterium]|jgi:large subunit ribosomal protein L25|nr:large subunit ribosomal protein [Patescibacteria group bacterium]